MCGIVGFNWEDKNLVIKMANSIKHRGPDGYGYYTDKHVSLGHRRLAIIDLSERGKQPMCNEDGNIWITFNGEIYNFKELRPELEAKGHKFKSETDTEVIIHAYEEYGYDCVKKFNGMFAFAIWDENKKELFLARDHLGIKPLYYYWDGKEFIFASEIKAILKHDIQRKVNSISLNKLLSYRFVPGMDTLFSNIYKLMPANYLIFNNGIKIRQYWDIDSDQILHVDYINKFNMLLKESISYHMIADVEVGSFLSGGIDSSIISALAQNVVKSNNKTLKTFTVYFDHFSEKDYAKSVADYIGSEHYEFYIDENKAINSLSFIMKHYDEPMLDFANIPNYFISKFARKKVKVVLAGEGGDELFLGYDYYRRMDKVRKNLSLFGSLLKYFQFINNKKLKRAAELYDKFDNMEDYYLTFCGTFPNKSSNVFNVNLGKFNYFLNKLSYFELKTSLPEYLLMKADKMTMANSLEERVPYLNPKIAEFAFKLPISMKLRGENEKYILKILGKDLIPKEIVNRKKQGYGVPYQRWITSGSFGKILLNDTEFSSDIRQIITKAEIDKILSNYKSNFTYANQLWMLYSLNKWGEFNDINF